MREPRYPLPRVVCCTRLKSSERPISTPSTGAKGDARGLSSFLGASRAGVWLFEQDEHGEGASRTAVRLHLRIRPRPVVEVDKRMHPSNPHQDVRVRRSLFRVGFDNDPSAGSPTETLLRLLLPLNDKVQWTSRDVAGSEPPTSPRSEHFTGPFNR